MARMKMSASVEIHTYNKISEISRKYFKKNNSKAIDWIVRHLDMNEFARSMAKYHNAEFQRFMQMIEQEQLEQSNISKMVQEAKC